MQERIRTGDLSTKVTHFYVLLAGVILKLTVESVCDIAPLILLHSAEN